MLPFIEQGDLPHLGSLVSGGSRRALRSTMPPITPCAWSSFMTGKNPGKHGLLDFVEPVPDAHQFRFTNASSRHGESIWSLAGRHGRRVGVVNVPMTFPPEKVNGFMISGLDTPHELSPYMYPSSIRKELRRAAIPYRVDQQHLGNMRSDRRRSRQLQAINAAETARTESFRHLSRKFGTDLSMIVYGATDQVQHHFWHYMDSSHDKYDPAGAKKFANAIRDTYRHIDDQIGELLADCDDNTVVVVMSDHGFGPTTNVRLRLNKMLEEAGLLTYAPARQAGRMRQTLGGLLDRVLRSTLSSDAKRTLAGLFPRIRLWFEDLDQAQIDWPKTLAFVNETYRSSPAVWINRQAGLTDERIAQLRDEISQRLLDLVDPQTGQRVVRDVVRPQEIYDGDFARHAPDLLPSWWEDGFLLEDSVPGDPTQSVVERSQSPVVGGVEFSGSHRMGGVLILNGPSIRQGQVADDASIIDVAPTILHLMGLPVPADMDGEVLVDSLEERFVESHPVQFEDDDGERAIGSNGHVAFTDEEQELIARRLTALGYLSR